MIDYKYEGDNIMIVMSYLKFVQDVKLGNLILCLDGIISFFVLECDIVGGKVKCRCENMVSLGEYKNVNLFGVIVDFFIFMQ